MTESEYAYCDLCNHRLKKAECKRVSITAINLILQEGVDTERTVIYACTRCYPILKLTFIDAVLKVLDAEGSEGYWKYLLDEEKYNAKGYCIWYYLLPCWRGYCYYSKVRYNSHYGYSVREEV